MIGSAALLLFGIIIFALLIFVPGYVLLYLKGLNSWTRICKRPKLRRSLVSQGDPGAVFMTVGGLFATILIVLLSIWGHS